MKHLSILIITFVFLLIGSITINSQTSPPERFSLEGAITIGNSDTPLPPDGTIRWNPTTEDFEGYNGDNWVSLTGNAKAFGRSNPYSYEDQILIASNGQANDSYGESVATHNEYIAIGSEHSNSGSGSVYLYKNGISEGIITYTGAGSLGEQLDMDGDWIAIGADDGNAYVYNILKAEINPLKFANNAMVVSEFIEIDDNDIIVKGTDSSLYHFELISNDWVEKGMVSSKEISTNQFDISNNILVTKELTGEDIQTYAYNGTSWGADQTISTAAGFQALWPSIDGNTMTITYNHLTDRVNNPAYIKVFIKQGGTWSEDAQLFLPKENNIGITKYKDGVIIAVAGQEAVDPNQNLNNGQGKVYVFAQKFSTWKETAILTSSDGRAQDIFGFDIDVSSSNIVVGALWSDVFMANRQGKAYIFSK